MIGVDGEVRVIDGADDRSHAIALVASAVAGRLGRNGCACCCIVYAACVAVARSHLAFRIHARALRSDVALHARSGAIANRSTSLVARGIFGEGRIGRNTCDTNVAGALTGINGQVHVVGRADDSSHAIALNLLAITGSLEHDGSAICRIVKSARMGGAGAGLAFRIYACALRCGVALHAAAIAVANRAATLHTCRVGRQGRIGRHARGAYVACALLAIDRNVRVIRDADLGTHAVALLLLTITGRLGGHRRSNRRVRESAHVVGTGSGLAFRIHSRALCGGVTRDACATAVAKRSTILAARCRRGGW